MVYVAGGVYIPKYPSGVQQPKRKVGRVGEGLAKQSITRAHAHVYRAHGHVYFLCIISMYFPLYNCAYTRTQTRKKITKINTCFTILFNIM